MLRKFCSRQFKGLCAYLICFASIIPTETTSKAKVYYEKVTDDTFDFLVKHCSVSSAPWVLPRAPMGSNQGTHG